MKRNIVKASFFFCVSGFLTAAPQLRLSQQAVGPISIAAGSAGPAQVVDAYNVGDGNLNLRVASSVPWISATVGAQRNCLFREGTCTPIQISLQTASLTRGNYTGTVVVSDPAAVDAPQVITVTALVGGGVPERIDLFAPLNGRAEYVFSTSNPLNIAAFTQTGGNWLSVVTEGGSPFRPGTTYRVVAIAPPGSNIYSGSIVTTGSALAAENRTVPVTLRVTPQPIAQLSADRIELRVAQGGPRQTRNLTIANAGTGPIDVTGATASTVSGGNWLSVERPQPGVLTVSANPAGLATGTYLGTVVLASNAAQGAISIPVRLDVVAAGPPLATYRGVVNNATFEAGDVLAQGSIVAIFGEQFTTGDASQAASLPLSTDLGGARVYVNNQPAPIYYVSANQINFQIPYDASPGNAIVRVERDGQRGNDVSVRIARGVPRLLRLGIGNYGIIVNQDGTFPMPVTAGIPSRPARSGETLVIYAIGLGPTTPAVVAGAGAPSSPLSVVPGDHRVSFGSAGPFGSGAVDVAPLFVGLTPNFVGLYQINVTIPAETPKGASVPLALVGPDGASNTVSVAIE